MVGCDHHRFCRSFYAEFASYPLTRRLVYIFTLHASKTVECIIGPLGASSKLDDTVQRCGSSTFSPPNGHTVVIVIIARTVDQTKHVGHHSLFFFYPFEILFSSPSTTLQFSTEMAVSSSACPRASFDYSAK